MYKIGILFQDREFEHDIYELIRAFYPGSEICSFYEEEEAGCDLYFRIEKQGDSCVIRYEDHENKGVTSAEFIEGQSSDALISCVDADDSEAKERAHAIRKERKDIVKIALYKLLVKLTGKTLPWGNLTGIRPTKIPMKLLEEGKSREEIYRYMKDTYLASDEKIELATDIAERENAILKKIDYDNGYSLYIGIPFCPTTCLYCSFTSYPLVSWKNRVDAYLDALEKEIDYTAAKFYHKHLNSIYIGGGTPTTLEPYQLDRLIRKIKCSFDLSDCLEFTVEAGRADSITREKLEVLYRHQVSRISVNPQTMKQETLDIIGRKASVEQVLTAYRLAREVGFDNINMDLILGLPGELEADVQRTIEKIVELAPDSLTVHSLAIKRASRLNQWIQENGVSMLHNTDETMKIAAAGAEKLGMKPYYLYRQKNMSGNFENTGYARPGKYGLYNILIMEEKQTIVALGAGSITKGVFPDGRIERCDNVKDVGLYIEKIDEMIKRKRELFT